MNRRRIAAGVLAVTLAGAGALAAARQDVLPGEWEAVTTDLNGKVGDRVTTARSCIAPGADLAAVLRKQLAQGCRDTRFNVGGGRIDVVSICPTGTSTITGTYTPTTMTLAMRSTLRMGKTSVPFNLDVRSRRVAAACTDSDD